MDSLPTARSYCNLKSQISPRTGLGRDVPLEVPQRGHRQEEQCGESPAIAKPSDTIAMVPRLDQPKGMC